jgi:hypothetical protein
LTSRHAVTKGAASYTWPGSGFWRAPNPGRRFLAAEVRETANAVIAEAEAASQPGARR